mmetsp:Transcript_36191/g.111012  ORF Transcript_36191/g.111012 Transcript_36191/m.111012 type:complete len:217 (+) Transcript_36191:259-909(+)
MREPERRVLGAERERPEMPVELGGRVGEARRLGREAHVRVRERLRVDLLLRVRRREELGLARGHDDVEAVRRRRDVLPEARHVEFFRLLPAEPARVVARDVDRVAERLPERGAFFTGRRLLDDAVRARAPEPLADVVGRRRVDDDDARAGRLGALQELHAALEAHVVRRGVERACEYDEVLLGRGARGRQEGHPCWLVATILRWAAAQKKTDWSAL